jgi:hypothetical protein
MPERVQRKLRKKLRRKSAKLKGAVKKLNKEE